MWNPKVLKSDLPDQVTKHLMVDGNEFGTKVSDLADQFDVTYTAMHQICESDPRLELIELSKCDRVRVKRIIVGWNPDEI